jgi:hypothetical protein
MGVGNSAKGHFFPSDFIYLKNLNYNKETESKWDLSMKSFIVLKYKIFEEEESKIPMTIKKNSTNSLISLNESFSTSPEKARDVNLVSPNKKSNEICPIPLEEKSENNTDNSEGTEIIKDFKNLINIFQKPPQSSKTPRGSNNLNNFDMNKIKLKDNDDSISMFEKSVNLIDNRTTFDTISVNSTITCSNKKKSVLLPPTHNKEKYRKEMSVLYSDEKELEIDLEKSSSSKSRPIKTNIQPSISNRNSSEINISQLNPVNISRNSSNIISLQSFYANTQSIKEPPFSTGKNILETASVYSRSESSNFKNELVDNNGFLKCQDFPLSDLEETPPDSFCEAFFIAGLPQTNAQTLNESEDCLAPCRHTNCSKLPAYKPEILTRYPTKDSSRLEMNSLLASLCFPLGVKLCYTTKENQISTHTNYSTSIVNQDGSKFYLMTYHFFIKFNNNVFQKLYQINPAKEFLHLEKVLGLIDNDPCLKKRVEEKLEKQLELCTQLNFNENVYVPFVACLISKNPYIKQMEKSLQTILKQLVEAKPNQEDIKHLILHLTREVPIPPSNYILSFNLPSFLAPLQITSGIYKDLPIIDGKMLSLLDTFSIENIIIIHHLMIMEQKILFIGNEFKKIYEIIDHFTSLLYPLQWIHTYIPILSQEMIKYLQSFMPFIMGLEESLVNLAKPYLAEEDNIYYVYINKDKIDISSNRKGKKLKRKELV